MRTLVNKMALGQDLLRVPQISLPNYHSSNNPSTHYYGDRKIPKTPQSGEPGHEIELRPYEYEQMLTKRRTVSSSLSTTTYNSNHQNSRMAATR
jgi:hypothetical protein